MSKFVGARFIHDHYCCAESILKSSESYEHIYIQNVKWHNIASLNPPQRDKSGWVSDGCVHSHRVNGCSFNRQWIIQCGTRLELMENSSEMTPKKHELPWIFSVRSLNWVVFQHSPKWQILNIRIITQVSLYRHLKQIHFCIKKQFTRTNSFCCKLLSCIRAIHL